MYLQLLTRRADKCILFIVQPNSYFHSHFSLTYICMFRAFYVGGEKNVTYILSTLWCLKSAYHVETHKAFENYESNAYSFYSYLLLFIYNDWIKSLLYSKLLENNCKITDFWNYIIYFKIRCFDNQLLQNDSKFQELWFPKTLFIFVYFKSFSVHCTA